MNKYIDKAAATDIVINAMQAYDGKDSNAIRLLRTIATSIRALPDTSCSDPEKEDMRDLLCRAVQDFQAISDAIAHPCRLRFEDCEACPFGRPDKPKGYFCNNKPWRYEEEAKLYIANQHELQPVELGHWVDVKMEAENKIALDAAISILQEQLKDYNRDWENEICRAEREDGRRDLEQQLKWLTDLKRFYDLIRWYKAELNGWKKDPFSIIAEECRTKSCKFCQWEEKCPYAGKFEYHPEDWRAEND